jgi:hypothetical protein
VKSLCGKIRGKPTHWRDLGKAAAVGEVTGTCTLQPDGIMAQASWERLAEIKSGRTGSQQEARSNLQGPLEISVDTRSPEEGAGLAHELVGARKKG